MKTGDCRKTQKIWLADQDRRSISQAKLFEAHLKDCPSCRLELEVYELAALDDSCLPAPPLDELCRRRWLDAALEKAENPHPESRGQLPSLSSKDTPRIRRRLVIGAIAASVVFVSMLSFLLMDSKQEANYPADDNSSRESPVESNGRVLLLAGKVEVSDSPKMRHGEIHAGQSLEVADGHVALSLVQGVSLIAKNSTSLFIDCINSQCVGVTLHRGHILVEVSPERKGTPFFIDTRAGRIVVTGTALGVTVEEETVQVEVYRGSVLLEEKDGTSRRLGFGKLSEFGTTTLLSIDEEQMKAATGQMRIVDLLDDTTGATLDVQSSPSGALVLLDDVVVGRTPFHAVLRPGHRTLALELEGYDSIKELIDLSSDTTRSRTFLLSRSEKSDKEQEKQSHEILEASPPSPETLLETAQKHRKAGRWQRAEVAYRTLVRYYPKRAEARSSLISLGFIQLEHLHLPGKALKSYNLYLKRAPSGPLAQEAAFGRAMALRALGRRDAEIEALKRFIEQYPLASQQSRARKRLSMLE